MHWCLSFHASATADSRLSNAGFESDTNGENQTLFGWQTYGPNNFNEANSAIAHSGTNYLQGLSGVHRRGQLYRHLSGLHFRAGRNLFCRRLGLHACGDVLAGQNPAWIEVTFRSALAPFWRSIGRRSSPPISSPPARSPKTSGTDLRVTNQYDPDSYQVDQYRRPAWLRRREPFLSATRLSCKATPIIPAAPSISMI